MCAKERSTLSEAKIRLVVPPGREMIDLLGQGDHLLKVGTHKEIRVHHRRTAREIDFTATDSAMLLPTTHSESEGVGVDVPA